MATATTVERYLDRAHVPFATIRCRRRGGACDAGRAAAAPSRQLLKGVLLEAEGEYLLVVLPSARHLRLDVLSRQLDRDVTVATRHDVARVFRDCKAGAVPALGPAYGVETVWDDSVLDCEELYIEAGDREHLVRMRTQDYVDAMRHCPHGQFTEPA